MSDILSTTLSITGGVWLSLSLIAYAAALVLNKHCKGHPLAHPLITTSAIISLALLVSQVSVANYQTSASFLHWLLGPATVALALPIYRQWQVLKHYGWRLLLSIVIGGVIAPITAWFGLWISSASAALQMSMLVKSITTPLAMETASQINGTPALAAVFVIMTGIAGAIMSSWVFQLCKVEDTQAQGIALGTVAHAVGTAKALQLGDDVAAMATLGLCVNGIVTAIVLPLFFISA